MTTLHQLTERLRRARRELDRQVGEARLVAVTGQRITAEVAELRGTVELHEKAAVLLASIGEQRQATAQAQIEALVTKGLQSIFGDDLSFHLIAATRGKRPEVDFVVRSRLGDTVVDTDVLHARGGGMAAVIGLLLRIVLLLLIPGDRPIPLLLDETCAHVSAEYRPRVAAFLRELVDLTGRLQIVMVTHADEFADVADVRYRFTQVDGITEVRTV